jgi:para-nitrobenzyl esterase
LSLSPTVTIAEGSIRGTASVVEGRKVSRFLGIPYAGSPAGARRFLPPVPAAGWAGTLDCTVPGPAAPQTPEVPAPPGRKLRAWSENDCLNLNVWTPQVDGAGLPVMVWVHGGAYVSGSGSDAMYDGGNLAGATGTVVVTINYRLGALGFLHLAELLGEEYADSSNSALLDVLEALRWVKRNIAAFGGDPDNVTLFGESAGAAAVGTLLGMPASQGLFRRVIMQSGTAERYRSGDDSSRISLEFLSLCGLEAAQARDLLTLPVEQLLEAQEKLVRRFGAQTFAVPLPFQPTAGTPSLPVPPLEAVRSGLNSEAALLIGTNLNEGSLPWRCGQRTCWSLRTPNAPRQCWPALVPPAARRSMPWRSLRLQAPSPAESNSWKLPFPTSSTGSPATGCWMPGEAPPGKTSHICLRGAALPWAASSAPATPWTSRSCSGSWGPRRPGSSPAEQRRSA